VTELESAAELLKAFAHPLRLAIVLQVREGERCVHELVDSLDATQPLVSQHLKVLRDAGVLTGRRRGREMAYTIADEHIVHIAIDAITHASEGRQAVQRRAATSPQRSR
jgi:ArsR family transcriptional regulator